MMTFFGREHKLEKLLNLVSTEPNMVIFIYGPINSGKTALMNEFIKGLSAGYVAFYINLRGRFIKSYKDIIKVPFSAEEGSPKELLADVLKNGLTYGGIPIPEKIFKRLLEDEKEDPFLFLEEYFRELLGKGKSQS